MTYTVSSGTLNSPIPYHTEWALSHYWDSAFQLQPNLMVPYKDNGRLTVKELTYNKKLSQCRRVIENAFGRLKGRFRRLKQLECKLERVPNTVTACCVLHNLSLCNDSEWHVLKMLTLMQKLQQDKLLLQPRKSETG